MKLKDFCIRIKIKENIYHQTNNSIGRDLLTQSIAFLKTISHTHIVGLPFSFLSPVRFFSRDFFY